MAHKKQTATFHFTQSVLGEENLKNKTEVTIILIIDYNQKKFTVQPFKNNQKAFHFDINSSYNSNKWLAVVRAINEAICFAQSELAALNMPIVDDDPEL